MKQKLAILAATLALGLLGAPAVAGTASKQGNPPGYGDNWNSGGGGSCGSCGGHSKNGGGHSKNGGGGGGGGGTNQDDRYLCIVGGRPVYASSIRHCRKLVYEFNYGYRYEEYHGSYEMSYATRKQLRKRAMRKESYVAHSSRKVSKRSLRRSHARRGHAHRSGNIYNIQNNGGVVIINKGGSF